MQNSAMSASSMLPIPATECQIKGNAKTRKNSHSQHLLCLVLAFTQKSYYWHGGTMVARVYASIPRLK